MRKACRLIGLNRSTSQYQPVASKEEKLTTRMKTLAYKHKRYGSPRLHVLLKKEGLVVNHKRTERIYRQEGLSLRVRTKKKRVMPVRGTMHWASGPQDVWSVDFVSDSLSDGRRFRILTIIDDFTRESPGILVARSISSRRVTSFIDQIALYRGYPNRIRVDNGPSSPAPGFMLGRRNKTSPLSIPVLGNPLTRPSLRVLTGRSEMKALTNIGFFLSLMLSPGLNSGGMSTTKNDPIAH